jgi:ABC-type polysaccharide/polyol phosphate transport system ATPase subunit
VELVGIGKQYVLHRQKPFLLREVLRRLSGRRSPTDEFWALRDIHLTVRRGETVGIIGRNGAGKSTMLGVIAGAITPTTGARRVHGRIGALLELGSGFHLDLTGRENIYLNASLLGLTRKEVEEQFNAIAEFSELGEFIDVSLRSYSSGMHMRLGFSVAAHIDPDTLIMDEAFAVGDQKFQEKCVARILEFKKRGASLLFVSHNADQVRTLCERAVWLDHGRVCMDGAAADVLDAYKKSRG